MASNLNDDKIKIPRSISWYLMRIWNVNVWIVKTDCDFVDYSLWTNKYKIQASTREKGESESKRNLNDMPVSAARKCKEKRERMAGGKAKWNININWFFPKWILCLYIKYDCNQFRSVLNCLNMKLCMFMLSCVCDIFSRLWCGGDGFSSLLDDLANILNAFSILIPILMLYFEFLNQSEHIDTHTIHTIQSTPERKLNLGHIIFICLRISTRQIQILAKINKEKRRTRTRTKEGDRKRQVREESKSTIQLEHYDSFCNINQCHVIYTYTNDLITEIEIFD